MTSRFLLLYLFSVGFWTMAQSSKFKLNGEIINHSTGKKESSVRVVLYQNGSPVKESSTGTDGTYMLEHALDVTKTFEVVYQKTGFFSKKVLFNLTKINPEKLVTMDPIDISMVEKSVGNELAFLESEPLQKITNIPLSPEDITYRDNMQTKIYTALSNKNKKPNPTNEIYDRGLNKAWDLINEGKLEEAKKLAENYVVLNPKHPEPQKILAEINRRKGISTSIDEDTTRQISDSMAEYLLATNPNMTINDLKKMMSLNQHQIDLRFIDSRNNLNNQFDSLKSNGSGAFPDTLGSNINELKRLNSQYQHEQNIAFNANKNEQTRELWELKRASKPFPSSQDSQRMSNEDNPADTLERKINFIPNELGKKYPEGVTKEKTEVVKDRGKIVCVIDTRIVVRYGQGSIYRKITGPGISSYTKDGVAILPGEWTRAIKD